MLKPQSVKCIASFNLHLLSMAWVYSRAYVLVAVDVIFPVMGCKTKYIYSSTVLKYNQLLCASLHYILEENIVLFNQRLYYLCY